MLDRYNYMDHPVGSPIYIAEPYGWSTMSVREFRVEKVTQGGQITAKCEGAALRINNRGKIVGDDVWCKRRVVSAEKAAQYMAEFAEYKWWQRVAKAAEAIEKATRDRNDVALNTAIGALAKAMEARQDRDGEAGSVEDDSAARQGLPEPQSDTPS